MVHRSVHPALLPGAYMLTWESPSVSGHPEADTSIPDILCQVQALGGTVRQNHTAPLMMRDYVQIWIMDGSATSTTPRPPHQGCMLRQEVPLSACQGLIF